LLVLSTLRYNAETWTFRERLIRDLLVEYFEMVYLRKIKSVTRRDRIGSEDIFNRLHIICGRIDCDTLDTRIG